MRKAYRGLEKVRRIFLLKNRLVLAPSRSATPFSARVLTKMRAFTTLSTPHMHVYGKVDGTYWLATLIGVPGIQADADHDRTSDRPT